jgi:hypothetical protein
MNTRALLYFLPIFLFACSSQPSDQTTQDQITTQIQPPLAGDFHNDTVFIIDPTIENHVETPNGSSLDIPANCLVDSEGNLVTEEVNMKFSQFHSVTDILASGIPMHYDTVGQVGAFESAGMFTLKAKTKSQNDVYIKDDNTIGVNLASDKDENFNFYELNEQTGDWTYEFSSPNPRDNFKYDPSTTPIEPEPASEDAFVLDLNLDKSSYSELDQFSGIIWEYTGDSDSLDPRKNKWVSKTKWTDFDLTPTYEKAFEYYLTMSSKKKKFTTRVKAVLSGDDFDIAMADFKQQKIDNEKKREQLQKPFIRSVNISGFGTYNYDYYHQMEEPAKMLADFDFGKHNNERENCVVFVVYPKRDVCVNYPMGQWKDFALDKNADSKIMAILPDNKVAVYRNDVSISYGKKEFTFKMDVLDTPIEDRDELVDLVYSL